MHNAKCTCTHIAPSASASVQCAQWHRAMWTVNLHVHGHVRVYMDVVFCCILRFHFSAVSCFCLRRYWKPSVWVSPHWNPTTIDTRRETFLWCCKTRKCQRSQDHKCLHTDANRILYASAKVCVCVCGKYTLGVSPALSSPCNPANWVKYTALHNVLPRNQKS